MSRDGLLYPYVPFAGALVWNRDQADSSPVKVHVSFSPDWFAARMGLDMGESWHWDPFLRQKSFAAMARALNTEFPRLRLGGDPDAIRGGLSQIANCAPVGALFGQEVMYSRGGWPENNRHLLDDDAADSLQVPAFESGKFFQDLMKQMDAIQGEWGAIDGELNYQGVLNTAFRLRGEQIFTDMVTAPERAHHVLDVVCRTTMRFADAVYARQAASGVVKDYFVTSNCVVNMISEEHYRIFVMPYDKKLSAHYAHFGVHNCGWKVDSYAKAYSEIRVAGLPGFRHPVRPCAAREPLPGYRPHGDPEPRRCDRAHRDGDPRHAGKAAGFPPRVPDPAGLTGRENAIGRG